MEVKELMAIEISSTHATVVGVFLCVLYDDYAPNKMHFSASRREGKKGKIFLLLRRVLNENFADIWISLST